ncbi:hypothetical protein N7454_002841 [Penicillium verhagenii]|nr:hypothetical protein N7454_002841 [Penicillium verhagenii]
MKAADGSQDTVDCKSYLFPRLDQGDNLPSLSTLGLLFAETTPNILKERENFHAWLRWTNNKLKEFCLDGLVSDLPRPENTDKIFENWTKASKQVSLWMKSNMKSALIEEIESGGEDISFADEFLNKAKDVFKREGVIAESLRVEQYCEMSPLDYDTATEWVNAYKYEFNALVLDYNIRSSPWMTPWMSILRLLSGINQHNEVVASNLRDWLTAQAGTEGIKDLTSWATNYHFNTFASHALEVLRLSNTENA